MGAFWRSMLTLLVLGSVGALSISLGEQDVLVVEHAVGLGFEPQCDKGEALPHEGDLLPPGLDTTDSATLTGIFQARATHGALEIAQMVAPYSPIIDIIVRSAKAERPETFFAQEVLLQYGDSIIDHVPKGRFKDALVIAKQLLAWCPKVTKIVVNFLLDMFDLSCFKKWRASSGDKSASDMEFLINALSRGFQVIDLVAEKMNIIEAYLPVGAEGFVDAFKEAAGAITPTSDALKTLLAADDTAVIKRFATSINTGSSTIMASVYADGTFLGLKKSRAKGRMWVRSGWKNWHPWAANSIFDCTVNFPAHVDASLISAHAGLQLMWFVGTDADLQDIDVSVCHGLHILAHLEVCMLVTKIGDVEIPRGFVMNIKAGFHMGLPGISFSFELGKAKTFATGIGSRIKTLIDNESNVGCMAEMKNIVNNYWPDIESFTCGTASI